MGPRWSRKRACLQGISPDLESRVSQIVILGNLTKQNRSFQLSIHETKLGTRLLANYKRDPQRTERMIVRARRYKDEFLRDMKQRNAQHIEYPAQPLQ